MVCGHKITEANKEGAITGDDAVFCEGKCNAWLHRTCIGLCNYMKLLVSQSLHIFVLIVISKQTKEIEDLKHLVKSLAEKLSAAKNKSLVLKANQAGSPKEHDNTTERSASAISGTDTNMEVTNSTLLQLLPTPLNQIRSLNVQADRNYNAVLYGIPECSKGIKKYN